MVLRAGLSVASECGGGGRVGVVHTARRRRIGRYFSIPTVGGGARMRCGPLRAAVGSRHGGLALAPRSGRRGADVQRNVSTAAHSAIPEAAGLFNPENDRDACGVGFVAQLSRVRRACVCIGMRLPD
jgi:hypothetical protein